MECITYNKETLKVAVDILRNGGVIAHPADTCYGLAADLLNENAIKKVQDIKGREDTKPMSIMLPVFMKMDIGEYVQLDDFSKMICEELLPGPVTIVLPKGDKVPDFFFPENKYIGLRIPYDMMTEDILTKFKGPLVTTSANVAGCTPCATCDEVIKIFENRKLKPDLAFQGAIRNACSPSTVILIKEKKVKILREGPMTKKQLENILRIKIN